MRITEETIIKGSTIVNGEWTRPCTPGTKDGKKKQVESVEFELYEGKVEKLHRNIKSKTEYIMCFVHFDAGTENLDGIYFSVWDEESTTDDNIVIPLDEDEKAALVGYAIQELRESRE